MKINKVFRTAALALASIAAIAPAPNVNAEVNHTQQTQKAQKDGVVTPIKSARQFVREDAGGLQVMSHNPGIPPQLYGQHYVRKGTHKRTNK